MESCTDSWADPIAAIDEKGEAVISMEKGKDGLVTIATIASQLLYEIQGPLYYNSDVTASIEDIVLKQIAKNEVHVSGVKGLPPPATTKGKQLFMTTSTVQQTG